jgi:hypothetical protein
MKYKCINTQVFFVFHKFLKINLDTDFKVFQFYSQSKASGVIGTPTIGFFGLLHERGERVCTTPTPPPSTSTLSCKILITMPVSKPCGPSPPVCKAEPKALLSSCVCWIAKKPKKIKWWKQKSHKHALTYVVSHSHQVITTRELNPKIVVLPLTIVDCYVIS